ncbi:MAG: transcriptional repressor [Succinivibrio sp.]
MTPQRRQIVQILASTCCISPKELWYEAREHIPDLGIATVYRLIRRLEQIGIISKTRTIGLQKIVPKLGRVETETGRLIVREGSCDDLNSIIKTGLVTRGTISRFSDIELSLVGDKIVITVKQEI